MFVTRLLKSLVVVSLINSGVAGALIYQVITVTQFGVFFLREYLGNEGV